jgi:hypothetical protein
VWCRTRSTASPAGRRKYSAFSLAMPVFLFSLSLSNSTSLPFALRKKTIYLRRFSPFEITARRLMNFSFLTLSVREY